jgi:hypothetical protein
MASEQAEHPHTSASIPNNSPHIGDAGNQGNYDFSVRREPIGLSVSGGHAMVEPGGALHVMLGVSNNLRRIGATRQRLLDRVFRRLPVGKMQTSHSVVLTGVILTPAFATS